MHHDEQVDLLNQLFDMRAKKTTSFAAEFRCQRTSVDVDEQHLQNEVAVLLGQTPLVAGLRCDLPAEGDYVTVDLGTTPAIVVRSETGAVRAFLNACRHRGSRVVSGRGNAQRVFRCPYHAWVYDIDCRLVGQPVAREAYCGLDRDSTRLVELPASEACGLIFVGMTDRIGPIDVPAFLAGVGPELSGHNLESFTLVGGRAGQWDMNWKLPYETFLEAYHVFSLHRDSLAKQILATFWNRMIDFTMGVVVSEDFEQQVQIQRNMESGMLPDRIFGRNEPALIHYHQSIDRALHMVTGTDG